LRLRVLKGAGRFLVSCILIEHVFAFSDTLLYLTYR
jgi:hypothetical protein